MEPVVIATHQNAGASPLSLSLLLACNVSDETIAQNVRCNSALDGVPWLSFRDAHGGVAVLVGGGPSAADLLPEIKAFRDKSAMIFGLNGAAGYLRENGIYPDYQVMIDARPENIGLLDRQTRCHIFASQVDPALVGMVDHPILMHLSTENVEDYLPEERRKKGDYALVGGGYGVGNSAICAAYVMGYRKFHCFGFDSSHRNGAGHAYAQPMNDGIPLVGTEVDGTVYKSSLPMKAHAERFQVIARDLESLGCTIAVHGDGLLPALFHKRRELKNG